MATKANQVELVLSVEGVKARASTAHQGTYLPLTFLPAHFAGKQLLIIVQPDADPETETPAGDLFAADAD